MNLGLGIIGMEIRGFADFGFVGIVSVAACLGVLFGISGTFNANPDTTKPITDADIRPDEQQKMDS